MQKKQLSLLEVFALSIAMVAPTGAMAFNTAGAANMAGINVPLAFILGGIGVIFTGISFVELGRRIPGEGSAYAYNRRALGEKGGFVSGWALILTYITFTTSSAAIVGNFLNVFLGHFGIHGPIPLYIIVALVLSDWLSHQGIEFSTRFALTLEIIAVFVLAILTVIIIVHGGDTGNTSAPLNPSHGTLGTLGGGMIFALMSFAGFEGAATIAPRAKKPAKAIRVALIGAVLFAMIFYCIVSYAEVIGFGTKNIAKMAGSSAPLNYLATRYVGGWMAIFIDFASVTSYFACFFGALNAGAFIMEAMANKGYMHPWLGELKGDKQTPTHALDLISGLSILLYVVFGIFGHISATNYYNYFGTIGMYPLLLVYVLVNIGAIVYFAKHREHFGFWKHVAAPVVGLLVMVFPIYSNLWPVPAKPYNIFPYVLIVWLVIGIFVYIARKHGQAED